MIGTEDVLEARNSASGRIVVEPRNSSRLASSSSTIASIAASAPSSVLELGRVRDPLGAPRVASASSLPERTRAVERALDRRLAALDPLAVDLDDASRRRRERAQTSAIPLPIRPPPTTPTRMARDASASRAAPRPPDGHAAAGAARRRAPAAPRRRDGKSSTGTTQTQFGSFAEPGRTIRPAPRSAAVRRASCAAASRSAEPRGASRVSVALRIDEDHVVHMCHFGTGPDDIEPCSQVLSGALRCAAGQATAEGTSFEESPDITGQGGR